jgi:hypothetical protein
MRVQGIAAPPKEWSWSYSKLKNFNTCPKRHYEIDVAKNYIDSGEGMAAGNVVHDVLAKACSGKAPLPKEHMHLQKWVDRVATGPGELFVEQKYAITRDFKPTTFFDRKVWYRGIADVVRIDRPVALALDWKTGKVLEDPVQLMLMACCLFVHFPELKRVRAEYIWLKDECTSPEVFDRAEVARELSHLLPNIDKLEKAAKEMDYPPKPNGLCKKYCKVTSCVFHGKGGHG